MKFVLFIFIYLLQKGSCSVFYPVDRSGHCKSWARKGACQKNPQYMQVYCRKSCHMCTVCTDEYYCRSYSSYYRCSNHHMRYACSVSCNVCRSGFDKRLECSAWASRGECSRNPVYMKSNCACSCAKITGKRKKVNGGYSSWSRWGSCTQSCNGGSQIRSRTCTNPKPSHGGADCTRLGSATESKRCNTKGCPVNGGYSNWAGWSSCSKLCNGGAKTRSRTCTSPKPTNNGADCTRLGPATVTVQCNTNRCPVITKASEPPVPPTKPTTTVNINEEICGKRTSSDAFTLHKRIVNGKDAKLTDWPWMANLRKKSDPRFLCGASILNEQYILSAAHCVALWGPAVASDYQVRIGESHIGPKVIEATERTFDIESITVHPSYNRITYNSDIALLKVKGTIPYNLVTRPICVPAQGKEFNPQSKCFIAGWGHGEEEGEKILKLQEAEMPLVNHDVCETAFPDSSDEITTNMICAGHKSGEFDACQGDSGGPLICDVGGRWQQAGIVSWGEGCGRKGKYGVFTKVSNYRQWIESVLKK